MQNGANHLVVLVLLDFAIFDVIVDFGDVVHVTVALKIIHLLILDAQE